MFMSRSPASILIDAVGKIVTKYWNAVRAAGPRENNGVNVEDLRLAYEYVTRLETGVYKLERDSFVREREWLATRVRNPAEEPRRESRGWSAADEIMSALFLTAVTAFGAIFAYQLLVLVLQAIAVILRDPLLLEHLMWGVLSALIPGVVVLVLARIMFYPLSQEKLAIGSYVYLQTFGHKTSKELQGERQLIVAMMTQQGEGFPASPEKGPELDPDVATGNLRDLPIPPGVTEIIMSANEGAIHEIRDQLRSVRRLHNYIGWASFAAFLVCLSVTLGLAIFGNSDSLQKLFGGVGFGGLIALFCYRQLREARKAQIALALYESYMAELRANLLECEQEADGIKRRSMRSEAWRYFRSGLNALWQEEQKKFFTGRKVENPPSPTE